MANRSLVSLLSSAVNEFENAIQLTERANVWRSRLAYFPSARFKNEHLTQIIELAFMRLFLTWEAFLEEAFILYLIGKRAPNGYSPIRHAVPLDRKHAMDLLTSEAYRIDWTAPDRLIARAKRFFKMGKPFYDVIQPRISLLNNMKTIRNAISHSSDDALRAFHTLVTNELTYYPPKMLPGSFLATTKPRLRPPKTYLQFYAETLQEMTETIVPV